MSGLGYCPYCGAPGKTREKRPDGYDTCENGHTYKSTASKEQPISKDAKECWRGVLDKLYWRNVPEYAMCPRCGGSGVIIYPSTSQWRGGISGQAVTPGVCNKCWGSGRSDITWPSHKEFEAMKCKLSK